MTDVLIMEQNHFQSIWGARGEAFKSNFQRSLKHNKLLKMCS